METVSKGLYIASWVAGMAGGGFLFAIGFVLAEEGEEVGGSLFILMGLAAVVFAAVMWLVLLHKGWRVIQDESARTTPGRAVGFLFIPFFNFYWIFQAVWGWAQDYNTYVEARGYSIPRMPEGLGLAISILAVVSIIPGIGTLIGLANFVLIILFMNKMVDGVNRLTRAAQLTPAEEGS
jgi:hypothetical protein